MNLDLMSEVLKLEKEQELNAMLDKYTDVLLAISEEWCSVCRVMEGTLINAAFELKGKAVVLKCNVAAAQSLAQQLKLRSIPAYVIITQGQISNILYGRQTIQALRQTWR